MQPHSNASRQPFSTSKKTGQQVLQRGCRAGPIHTPQGAFDDCSRSPHARCTECVCRLTGRCQTQASQTHQRRSNVHTATHKLSLLLLIQGLPDTRGHTHRHTISRHTISRPKPWHMVLLGAQTSQPPADTHKHLNARLGDQTSHAPHTRQRDHARPKRADGWCYTPHAHGKCHAGTHQMHLCRAAPCCTACDASRAAQDIVMAAPQHSAQGVGNSLIGTSRHKSIGTSPPNKNPTFCKN